jgi:germination protein M
MLTLILIAGLLAGCVNAGQSGRDPKELTVTLYFAGDQAMYVHPEQRTVLVNDDPLPSVLVNELIKGPEDPDLRKTLPAETRLLGLIVRDEIAYVDFSQEVYTKHWGGSSGEAMTIASVVNTLTELSEISSVQFLVEGEVQEAIWGHGVTSEPFQRMEDMIGK